ncbi:GNAT family N-acetyltransferase [Frankia gtarii]|uniref:GNAT family N-acetyltransferase n=1 Tax=Frankia gtarii TaxID=2950102 RepID=UPI0021BF1908|nr:GNAT family N-acetyltransferase [Frankia gtarii]
MTLAYGMPTRSEIPTVITSRLVLRGWRSEDLPRYAAMNADPETMRYLDGPFGLADTERLVTHLIGMWAIHGHGMWAVEERGSGEFLGRAGAYFADGWPGVEVAVSIRRDHWGHGLGTEAVRASLEFGFDQLSVAELITSTHRDNAGMNAIARRLGMTFRGVADVGPWRASNVYAMSRDEWRTRTTMAGPSFPRERENSVARPSGSSRPLG